MDKTTEAPPVGEKRSLNGTDSILRSRRVTSDGYSLFDRFECLENECLILDFVLTMYKLDLSFNGLRRVFKLSPLIDQPYITLGISQTMALI